MVVFDKGNWQERESVSDVCHDRRVKFKWERAVIQYNGTEGTQRLSEDVLITAYMHIFPEKVAESLRNLDQEYDTLSDVKAYVRKQMNAPFNPVLEAKPVPMDVGVADDEVGDSSVECSHDQVRSFVTRIVRWSAS